MRCLVVGGTGFLGGAIADALVEKGHDVSILSRQQTSRVTNPEINLIQADRYGDLTALNDQSFDWVFDSCAYEPNAVDALLKALNSDISRYVFISSISVYQDFSTPGIDETFAVPDATQADFEHVAKMQNADRASAGAYGSSYGPLKRASEIKAQEILGDRATNLRVGLLVGAGDYSDRLTWWVRRIDEASGQRQRVAAPAPKTRSVQMIDLKNVADFAVRCAQRAQGGVWNVTSEPVSLEDVLQEVVKVSKSDAQLVWVDETSIVDAGITPWVDVPLMAPVDKSFKHFLNVDTQKARLAGLAIRPIPATLEPLLNWDRSRREIGLHGGMTAEHEALLLDPSLMSAPT